MITKLMKFKGLLIILLKIKCQKLFYRNPQNKFQIIANKVKKKMMMIILKRHFA